MQVYYYIADSNPDAAINLLTSKYGYVIQDDYTVDELAYALQDVINTDGEVGLTDVMSLHPDKMIILELYAPQATSSTNQTASTIPMPSVPSLKMYQSYDRHYGRQNFFDNPVNVMVLAALGVAIYALAKK